MDKLTYAGNLSTLAPAMEKTNFHFVKADICDRDVVYGLEVGFEPLPSWQDAVSRYLKEAEL